MADGQKTLRIRKQILPRSIRRQLWRMIKLMMTLVSLTKFLLSRLKKLKLIWKMTLVTLTLRPLLRLSKLWPKRRAKTKLMTSVTLANLTMFQQPSKKAKKLRRKAIKNKMNLAILVIKTNKQMLSKMKRRKRTRA